LDRDHPKLFGRLNPLEKSKSDPTSSIKLRNATTESIIASVKRSTISEDNPINAYLRKEATPRTGTHNLKQVILFKLFEHTPFNLNKLVRDEKREERVVVGVDGHIESNRLIHHYQCMSDCIWDY
jgi:hypothetical protein